MSNSSGAVERFLLGPAEYKVYETLAPGGNTLAIDVENGVGQNVDGTMFGANAIIGVDTSEDGSAWTAVDVAPGGATALTVVPAGKAGVVASVGRFARVINTGTGLLSVIVKPLHRIQPRTTL